MLFIKMVINIFIFLAGVFILTFLVGRLIEKIRIPWIFGALIIGTILAIKNPFTAITSSPIFIFLSQLGMYFLLFIVGIELDLNKFNKNRNFIIKSTFFIIFLEAIFISLLIHFIFNYSILISIIVALSFATVGEAILIPILDEFKIINTKLGQTIIGIGTFDDVIEILILMIVPFLIIKDIGTSTNPLFTILSLIFLIGLTVIFLKFKKYNYKLKSLSLGALLFLSLFILFLFLGVGIFTDIAPFAALLAGFSIKAFIPARKFDGMKKIFKSICYGFFAPIFFLAIGVDMNMSYLIKFPLLILLFVVVANGAKLLGSWIMGKKELGVKRSILLGIGLSIRFSTSIIIIKILFDSGVVRADLYSLIVATSIVFKFLVPVLFSNLLVKWKIINKKKT